MNWPVWTNISTLLSSSLTIDNRSWLCCCWQWSGSSQRAAASASSWLCPGASYVPRPSWRKLSFRRCCCCWLLVGCGCWLLGYDDQEAWISGWTVVTIDTGQEALIVMMIQDGYCLFDDVQEQFMANIHRYKASIGGSFVLGNWLVG